MATFLREREGLTREGREVWIYTFARNSPQLRETNSHPLALDYPRIVVRTTGSNEIFTTLSPKTRTSRSGTVESCILEE